MPYKGGRRDPAELKFDKEYYTPEGAKSLSDRQLRKEYSRLRSIARKRLERFEHGKSREWMDTEVYRQNRGKYKPLKEMESNRELRYLFSDLSRFIMAETSTTTGLEKQRKQAIETFHAHGYEFINEAHYHKFTDFMEYARIANQNRIYDSERVARFYEATEKKKMSAIEMQKAFRSWSRKQEKLKKIRNINPRNSSMYRRDLDTK
jgi:hypothetical protein